MIENDLVILENSNEWQEFKTYYTEYNLFNQLNHFRYEDIHTNILGSLLDSNNPYELGIYPLQKLLELLINKDEKKVNISFDELKNNIIENVVIGLQKVYDNNRLDLKIDFRIKQKNYCIVLENKVLSEEHDNQCQRYYDYFITNKKENMDISYIFVYLSLEKRPSFLGVEHYICINYQELINNVIEPCSIKCLNPNPKIISLDTYLLCFSKLYEYVDYNYEIPISSKGEKLTINLYKKYNDLLIKLFDNNYYNDNKKVLDIYYYNVGKLIDRKIINDKYTKEVIDLKIYNIKCTYGGVKKTYKDCYLLIVKYLFARGLIKTDTDLDNLNKCVFSRSYVVASLVYDDLLYKDYYFLDNDIVGRLKLNGKDLYFYVGSISRVELKYFVTKINFIFNNVLEDLVIIN